MGTHQEEGKFFEAIEKNDIDTVKRFMQKTNVSLTSWDWTNQTAVHIAARYGHRDMMKLFLERDRSLLDIRDGYDYNVLHRATESGFIDMVKWLIEEYNADVNATVHETYGNTILHIAAAADQQQILKYLIEERHMDANLKNLQRQPITFSAAANKRIKIVKYLAEECKVELDVLDSRNDNILFISIMRRDLRVPKYLLNDRKLNIDINWRGHFGRTLVFLAARIRATKFVRYLVEDRGADVNIADDDGLTPLHRAVEYNNVNVVKFLVKHKAKLRALDKDGRAAIDLADENSETKSYLQMVMNSRRGRSKRFLATFPKSVDGDDGEIRDFSRRRRFVRNNDGESFYRQTFIPAINWSLFVQNTTPSSVISYSESPVGTSQMYTLQTTSYNFLIVLLNLLLQYLYSGGKRKHILMMSDAETDPIAHIECEKNFPGV